MRILDKVFDNVLVGITYIITFRSISKLVDFIFNTRDLTVSS